MKSFRANEYWINRLEEDFSLSSIGYRGLGVKYNEFLYRKRYKTIGRILNHYNVIDDKKKVIELGVGSGFYIKLWEMIGIKKYLGIDITTKSVESLTKQYPKYNFQQADISSQNLGISDKYDIITAFDVLFHIVDDEKFQNAIKNMSNLLTENSLLLISDVVFDEDHFYGYQTKHFKPRSNNFYNSVLTKNGLEVKQIINLFSFMHPRSVLPKNKFRRFFFKAFNKSLTFTLKKYPELGGIVGKVFYSIDCFLDNFRVDGYSTKLLIIQKN